MSAAGSGAGSGAVVVRGPSTAADIFSSFGADLQAGAEALQRQTATLAAPGGLTRLLASAAEKARSELLDLVDADRLRSAQQAQEQTRPGGASDAAAFRGAADMPPAPPSAYLDRGGGTGGADE